MMYKMIHYQFVTLSLILIIWSCGCDTKEINNSDLIEVIQRKLDEFQDIQQRDHQKWSEILECRLDYIINTKNGIDTSNKCVAPAHMRLLKDAIDRLTEDLAEVKRNTKPSNRCECKCNTETLTGKFQDPMNDLIMVNNDDDLELANRNSPIYSNTGLRLIKLGQKSYYIETEKKVSWSEANNICIKNGLKFVKIESNDENEKIASYIQLLNKVNFYWIGSTDRNTKRKFYWINGYEPIETNHTWNPWSYNHPTEFNDEEHCIELNTIYSTKWLDIPCSELRYFICEL